MNYILHGQSMLNSKHTSRIVKSTIVTLLTSVYTLSAAETGLALQKVSIHANSHSVRQIMQDIEKQTDYLFVYDKNEVDVNRRISINVSDKDVPEILNKMFEGTGITYRVIGKNITLVKNGGAAGNTGSQQTSGKITGTVVDQNGDPIIGANVVEKGTTNGTMTDIDGTFHISVAPGATLIISYIGYASSEVPVNGRTDFSLILKEDSEALDEVVVVGYGVQKKVNLTGSVATVNTETISNIPASNLTSALSGRLSGVNITQTAGKPGGGSSLSIRANGTWNDASPLYVIDGVVRDKFAFDGLDASEVENVSILKDGASAAIYGSRAANGVVLVTTKKGKLGKPEISYTGSIGISDATKIPEVFNAYEQALYTNEANKNNLIPEGDSRYYADDELEYFKNHKYNWIDDAWRNPIVTRHSVNVSGGTEKVRYFAGGNYYYETGSFNNLDFRKYSVRSNIEADLVEGLTASLAMNVESRKDNKPYWKYDNDNDNLSNLYNGLLRRSLFAPYIDGKPNGTFLAWHPLEVINGKHGYNRKQYSNYEINAALKYDVPFIKGLSLKLSYNRYERHTFIKQFNRPYNLYVFETTGTNNHIQTDKLKEVKTRNDGDFLYERYNRDHSYQLNAMATYNHTFGDHDINALFVYEQAESTNDYFNGQRNYFISSVVDQLFAGSSDAKDSSVDGSGSESGRLSYIGRVGYTYANKYLLEASFRYDGSVNFAPGHRWGFFPSLSVGYRISEEPFFKEKIHFIDYLKLRASIGKLGNDAVGGWQWMQQYKFTTGAYFGSVSDGIYANVIPNENITWEKSTDIDYGLDVNVLNNRLSVSVGGFYKHTYDILGSRLASLPTTFGGSMPSENYAKINTKGFEIEASFKDNIGEFSYSVGANLGYAVNKLIEKDEAENIRPYQSELGYNTDRAMGYVATDIIRTQEELDALPEGYTIFGQKPELGMLNYKDIRGADTDTPDGKIDSYDQDWVIKHTTPPVNYGFSLGGSWKGLSVDLFFQGVAGGERFYDQRTEWEGMEAGSYAFRSDYWTSENIDAKYPRAGYNNGASEASTFWIQNTSFLRLKNASVSYIFPKEIISKLKVSQAKLFFMGTNLCLLQDKIKAYDPENSSIMNYPLMRTYSFGINLSF